MSRIHSNLARTSMHNDLIQTEIMNSVKSNTSSTSVLTGTTNSLITSTNNKLDSFSGAINNHEIGDGTVKLQTYCYGHDVTAGKARALKVDSAGRLECNVSDIELHTGDIHLAVDGLEGLQTTANSTLNNIYTRQDDILTSSNAIKLTNDTIASKTSSLQSTNHTDLNNIYTRQDDILTSCNATKLTNDTIATKTSALLTANHTDLNNIYTRQDDILTSCNATKLTNDTIATKTSALLTANHTDLNNIYTRQDDILTSCNATKLTNDTIATKTSALLTANHTDLNNIYTRQDDILTATNAVKTNTQSVENCVSANKLNVNISSGGISGFATEDTLNNAEVHLGNIQTSVQLIDDVIGIDGSAGPAKCISIGATASLGGSIQEVACDADGHLQIDILSSALPSGAANEISNSAILSKITLLTSSEVKQLLSSVTINANSFSSEFDTENYERIRFFGETTANTGSDILLMGSNTSGGTFYVMGDILRGQTTASTHYVYATGVENLPRYIKIFNKSGSTNYEFTKLYLQGSGGRLGV